MEQFSALYTKWHHNLNKVAIVIASFSFVLEIIVSYLIIRYVPGTIRLPIPYYIALYIITPTAINFILVLLGKYILNSDSMTEDIKNYSSILILSTQLLNIASIHNMFSLTIILFSVPIVLTFIYSNKKITDRITFVSIIYMFISATFAKLDTQTNNSFYFIEVFIALILFIGCNVITKLIIDIEKEKNNILKISSIKQLQLEELVKCDSLTGLQNMATFYNMLEASIQATEFPLTIAVIDIDNFKSVNDTFGHEMGNEVLLCLSAQLQSSCGSKGHIFRYGGEEFTIIFPHTNPHEAKKMIEETQTILSNHRFDFMKDRVITFSCGIAVYPSSKYGAHDFFQLADRVMYQAKLSGKNKVMIRI